MIKLKLVQYIASLVQARQNCHSRKCSARNDLLLAASTVGFERHTETLEHIAKDILPSGSGIDSGTKIDLDKSKSDCLVLTLGFHHMNRDGYYDGWTEHVLRVRPSLVNEFDISISGRDRNQVKEYLYDTYHHVLSSEYSYSEIYEIDTKEEIKS